MKNFALIFIILVAVGFSSCSQSDSQKDVELAVESLKKGFIDADKDILEVLAANELVYCHSGGKVQNKAEFIEEVVSGKPLDFIKIDLENQTINVRGKTAVVHHIFSAEIINDGTPGNLRIGNVLVWQKQGSKWKMIARQAYKL